MIRPSPEIAAVVRRWNAAVRDRKASVLANMMSASEHLRYQGSDDGEFWQGAVFRQGFADHVGEIPGFDFEESVLEAFECGEVGWANCHATLRFHGTGNRVPHRFTFVLVLEEGQWRFVQWHVSNPTPNIDKIGIEHRALNALVEAAREGFRLDQREGLASVMFTDIAGSSELAAALGDRLWGGVIADHLALARETIGAQGGTLVKSLGDGTMSTFPSARAALLAARALQTRNAARSGEPALRLRIGLHSGEVIRAQDDFFGTVVNMAARIAALAGPGEIWLSETTRLICGDAAGLRFGPRREIALRGFDGTHKVSALDWRAA